VTAGRNINTKSQDWGTPPVYIKAVKKFFGGKIDLDPCSSNYSVVNADVEYILPDNDGLKDSWNYPSIYVNPPYGINKVNKTSIKDWLCRCAETNKLYKSEILALVPVATNTDHWKKSVFGKATAICFFYDTRLKFLENGNKGGKGAPMSCAMIYWGNNYQNFYDVFINYGAVVDIRSLVGEKIGKERKNSQKFIFETTN
jgi:hypothetical protein